MTDNGDDLSMKFRKFKTIISTTATRWKHPKYEMKVNNNDKVSSKKFEIDLYSVY